MAITMATTSHYPRDAKQERVKGRAPCGGLGAEPPRSTPHPSNIKHNKLHNGSDRNYSHTDVQKFISASALFFAFLHVSLAIC